MGRPAKWKDIPAEQVLAMVQLGCSAVEIAPIFGVSHDTISRRFAKEFAKGNALRKVKLRRLQMKAAEGGSVPMLIFLGKNMLGQSDRVTYEQAAEVPKTVRVTRELTPALNGHGANGDGCRRS